MKTINVDSKVHKVAKLIAAEMGISIKELIEGLIKNLEAKEE